MAQRPTHYVWRSASRAETELRGIGRILDHFPLVLHGYGLAQRVKAFARDIISCDVIYLKEE